MSSDLISTPGSLLGDATDATLPGRMRGDLNDELLATDFWTDDMLFRAGIPVVDVPFVSCGGGMGSFVLVDYLRATGVSTDDIRVLSNLEFPWQTYEYLARVSQIPPAERLRSDSSGMPDCLWGFPSYALREARREKRLRPIWKVLTEPILNDYWAPRGAAVLQGLAKEAARIRYGEMLVNGQVGMVRRRTGDGFFTILTPPPGTSDTRRVAYRSQHVHLAIGCPGLKLVPDLQEYRTKYNDLASRTVSAFEPHEHVYEDLLREPGTVLVRGGGVVASRVLQRLMEDRIHNGAQTTILHLFRTYYSGRHNKWGLARRRGAHGFAFQGFNAPKSAWGGQHIQQMLKLEGKDRKELYELTGGVNTPYRKLWLDEMKQGRQEGWYITYEGDVTDVRPAADGVLTTVRQKDGTTAALEAQVIIDCTGLEADIREHRIFADLLDHSGAGRNPLGRLDVAQTFEARGTRSGRGRIYASGSATYGGYFAGVDTFLGLQLSAQRITDDLAAQGFCERIGIGRSVSQWWKWMRNRQI